MHENHIDEARRLLKPVKVNLHKTPGWLTKRLAAYRKAHGLMEMPASMLLTGLVGDICGTGDWLDHWGTSKIGDNLLFVSEPYNFNSRTAHALDRFCERLGGLEWDVGPNSWWNPGSTVCITIREKRVD